MIAAPLLTKASPRTRSGQVRASCKAIIPPADDPTTSGVIELEMVEQGDRVAGEIVEGEGRSTYSESPAQRRS